MIGRLLLRWELQQSLRSYWFLANAGVFIVGGLLLMVFGQSNVSVLGYRGFALALFFVPLMALLPSTAAIAGDRELGTLDYLLAQPVTRGEVYSGKWAGVTAALVLSLSLAFGVTGSIAAARGVPSGLVAALLALTLLLAVTFVSIGMWISSTATSRTRAVSIGLTVWLALIALGSLGLMSAFVRWGLPAGLLQGWVLVNPVEAYRLAAVAILSPELELLGPAGAALVERFGQTGLVMGACGSLLAWAGIGYGAGRWLFGRSGA